MNQLDTKASPSQSKESLGLIIGVAATALIAPSVEGSSISPADLRPTPIVAPLSPNENESWANLTLPQDPQKPEQRPTQNTPQAAPAPQSPQSPPNQTQTPNQKAEAAPQPPKVETPPAPKPETRPEPPPSGQRPLPDGSSFAASLQALRDEVRAGREESKRLHDQLSGMQAELRAAETRPQNAPAETDSGFFWKALTTVTAFMAFQGYWRWRYRTRDDFKRKESDLRGMLRNESLYFEDAKFVIAYHEPRGTGASDQDQPREKDKKRDEKKDREKHSKEPGQLIVENFRIPRDIGIDLETIIGPYCSEHLRRAALRCSPQDPFIMDYVEREPIPWSWIRDEFFRWEFKSALRLFQARQNDEKRFTSDLINLRLKTALESALGVQSVDIFEGKERKPHHFLIAVLCDVQPSQKSPTGEMRKIIVRVVSDDQFDLFGDKNIVAKMHQSNFDNMSREIELISMLREREEALVPGDRHVNPAGLPEEHPRASRPEFGYATAVRLILQPAKKKSSGNADYIRTVYGRNDLKANHVPPSWTQDLARFVKPDPNDKPQ